MKKLLLVLLLIPFALSALQVSIDEPVIYNSRFENDLPVNYDIGKPEIAFVPLKILLPMGEEIENFRVNLQYQN